MGVSKYELLRAQGQREREGDIAVNVTVVDETLAGAAASSRRRPPPASDGHKDEAPPAGRPPLRRALR